jgi:hypothetical protein
VHTYAAHHAYSNILVLLLLLSALLCCCVQCVIGFGAACTYSPAYSSASFTAPPTPESPLVLTNLPSLVLSTVYEYDCLCRHQRGQLR